MKKADIGLVGLAVMGENLVMNMESKGFTVAVFNRTTEKVENFVNGRAKGKNIIGTYSLQELADNLEKPRKIMMMVKAGQAVDSLIDQLIPFLESGDILIDGGNSHFPDTIRRTEYVESKGLLYIGTGVSGGEEGALKGPSMMPGGSPAAWESVKPIFQAICAKVEDGSPCCDWVGENGAGHFVKMVHNGIEYGDMQLICEAYQLMRDGLGLTSAEMHDVFSSWNETELDSYLIEITRDILGYQDEKGETVPPESISDETGKIGLVHPEELAETERSRWKKYAGKEKWKQPFPQLKMPVCQGQHDFSALSGVQVTELFLITAAGKWGLYQGSDRNRYISYHMADLLHGYGAQMVFDGIWRGPEYGPEIITAERVVFYRF